MLTPLNRLTRIMVILVACLGVAVWISGAAAFAQETQPATPPASTSSMPPPADPGAMQPQAAPADTATTPPEASPVPAAPPATPDTPPSGPSASNGSPAPPPADTTATQPAEPPTSTSSATPPPADTTAAQPAAAPAPAAPPSTPPSTPVDTKPAAATAESTLTQALAAYEKQDFAAAAEAFKNAIDSDPSSVEAHYYLGYALYKLKRFDEARVAFTQAYQLRSDYLPPVVQAKK